MTICSVEGCGRGGRLTKGLCGRHYMRLLREGTTEDGAGSRRRAEQGARHSRHPMYPAWQQMILRCHHRKKSDYPRYGGNGITVCQRWRDSFQNFLADMGERPEGMTLDRIDGLGPYSPENCRWADNHTQRVNRTPEGDARTRRAASEAKKEFWRRWRQERGLPTTPPTRREYRARIAAESAVQRRPE